MQDFIRARSAEQKEARMTDIKRATADLFERHPYHEITLTTIAERLGWSRGNLYKYAGTKEEIFLELATDARDAYAAALDAAFPEGCGYPLPVAAEVWAGVLNAHRAWLRYGDLLFTIIETNVSVERLASFKRGHYAWLDAFAPRFAAMAGCRAERVGWLVDTVFFHGVGLVNSCENNPLVREALELIGIERAPLDFRTEMRDFIAMCLKREAARS